MRLFKFDAELAVRRAQREVDAERTRGPLTGAFLLKGGVLSLFVAAAVIGLASRFSIAIATQEYLCLPPYRIWIIDKYDTKPARGEIFAFASLGLGPVFEDGTTIVKVIEGMPGDEVSVGTQQVTINGEVVAEGLQVATDRGIDPARYVRSGTIEQERYWFFGKTPDSFDSRYWGSVSKSQIIGKAYPLW